MGSGVAASYFLSLPVEAYGKAARRKDCAQLLSSMETFTVTPENPDYRVVGETGLVWGTCTIVVHPKGGETATFRMRFSRTYIKLTACGSCSYTMSPPFRTATKGQGRVLVDAYPNRRRTHGLFS